MPETGTIQILALLAAALAGFGLGVWLWRALTLRDRRETEQRHANEIRDIRDRWQQAQQELDKRAQSRSKGSQVRSQPQQAALVKPKASPTAPAEAPATVSEPAPAKPVQAAAVQPQPSVTPDDLKRIKGVGKALERRLRELDVRTFAQIAAWTDADIERIEAGLQSIPGRIRRDRWVEQANKLDSGAQAR